MIWFNSPANFIANFRFYELLQFRLTRSRTLETATRSFPIALKGFRILGLKNLLEMSPALLCPYIHLGFHSYNLSVHFILASQWMKDIVDQMALNSLHNWSDFAFKYWSPRMLLIRPSHDIPMPAFSIFPVYSNTANITRAREIYLQPMVLERMSSHFNCSLPSPCKKGS